MDVNERRRHIERIIRTGNKIAGQMGARFSVDRRKLRDFVRHLKALAALQPEQRG